MTVINGIESAEVKVRRSEVQYAIMNNETVEDKLHVIMVVSNPCKYNRRWILAKQFIGRMEAQQDVELYVVELVYGDELYHITKPDNPRHLQLRASVPLWHKENMINLGVKKLLPQNWKAMAWIDADIEFENPSWATDTLKILNGCKDIVQLFSHCLDMDRNENTMSIFQGFGYQYDTGKKYCNQGKGFWHPGFAWACTRKAFERMGGLLDISILGAGDHQMALSILGYTKTVRDDASEGYKRAIADFAKRSSSLRLGYTPGVIKHYFHGSKSNRKYMERWQILIKHQYDPFVHVNYEDGIIVPSCCAPSGLFDDIFEYFQQRKEDD